MPVEITQADINVLRTLEPRKSILNFTETELAATEKWAEKFQGELSKKSPFYRLINGDWRENDESRVPIINVEDKSATFQSVSADIKSQIIQRGIIVNTDTNWNIQISRRGLEDTLTYGRKHKDQNIYNMVYHANDLVSSGILLDSVITEKNNDNKAFNSMFMHKLYGICKIDKQPYIVKIAIEEFAGNKNDTIKRLYNLQDINIEPIKRAAFADKRLALSVLNGSDISISDLFQLVKSFDKDFYINKRSEKQIEKNHTNETERNDTMDKQNYSIFFIESGGEQAYFRDDNTDVNAFIQRLADCNENYPDFLKDCTKISEEEFAGLEQSEKTPPIFCAEINLDTTDPMGFEKPKELTIWDNDKIATINLDEAIQSIKENGTVNLDYQKFAARYYEQEEVITAGTIDKYGLDIDFGNIEGVVLKTSTENYIGGIDSNGHERRDNYSVSENEVKIYYTEHHSEDINYGSIVRLDSEEQFDKMKITIDEALEEIQNFLDEALNDRDKTVFIKYIDGREEYIDPNKLLKTKTETEKNSQITSKYLDSLEQLNNAYDDFSYHNSIFNNEHIAFVDNHGQLPYDLNTAENRNIVTEYINIQLNGGNITEAQKESLENLRQEIRNFEEPLFNQTVEEMSQWADEVIDKSNGRDDPDRDDFER